MVELVDTQDLKSCGHLPVRVQVPLLVHSIEVLVFLPFLKKASMFSTA